MRSPDFYFCLSLTNARSFFLFVFLSSLLFPLCFLAVAASAAFELSLSSHYDQNSLCFRVHPLIWVERTWSDEHKVEPRPLEFVQQFIGPVWLRARNILCLIAFFLYGFFSLCWTTTTTTTIIITKNILSTYSTGSIGWNIILATTKILMSLLSERASWRTTDMEEDRLRKVQR